MYNMYTRSSSSNIIYIQGLVLVQTVRKQIFKELILYSIHLKLQIIITALAHKNQANTSFLLANYR